MENQTLWYLSQEDWGLEIGDSGYESVKRLAQNLFSTNPHSI